MQGEWNGYPLDGENVNLDKDREFSQNLIVCSNARIYNDDLWQCFLTNLPPKIFKLTHIISRNFKISSNFGKFLIKITINVFDR